MAVPLPEGAVPPLERLRGMLVEQTGRLSVLDAAAGAAWEDDALRRFRVSIRRLRSLLRAAGPLVDREWADGLRSELAWLGAAAGPARDLDVLLADLRTTAAHFDPGETFTIARPLQQLELERAAAREALVVALASDRCAALFARLRRETEDPPAGAAPDAPLAELAAGAFRRLRKTARRLDRPATDDELHGLRLRVKRSRYAAELAEPGVGKDATRYLERAKALQDILGAHQDAAVAEQRLRQLLGTAQAGRWAVAGGRLIEAQYARRDAARAAWPAAWWQLEKQGRIAWSLRR